MLVIGDLNIHNLTGNECDIFNKEYICEDQTEINSLIKKFGFRKEDNIFKSNLAFTFKKKDVLYSFYDSSNYLMLHAIYRLSLGNIYKPRYAVRLTEWATCKARIKFIHDNVYSWCNRVETYLALNKELHTHDEGNKRMVESYANGLSTWVINTYGIDKNIYKSRPFDIYTKRDLYEVVAESDRSCYLQIMLNPSNDNRDDYVTDHLFNSKLVYTEKIKAVIEKIYVELINEYILPELEISKTLPKDIFKLFLKSYMNICSSYTSYAFTNFAVHNYHTILEKYNEKMITTVLMAYINNKMIDRIDEKGKESISNR